MTFDQVKEFLTSWGMHFDTPDESSTTIPYPQVYERMLDDVKSHTHAVMSRGSKTYRGTEAIQVAIQVRRFISSITETSDGETYLNCEDWDEIEEAWDKFNKKG